MLKSNWIWRQVRRTVPSPTHAQGQRERNLFRQVWCSASTCEVSKVLRRLLQATCQENYLTKMNVNERLIKTHQQPKANSTTKNENEWPKCKLRATKFGEGGKPTRCLSHFCLRRRHSHQKPSTTHATKPPATARFWQPEEIPSRHATHTWTHKFNCETT